MQLPNFAYQSSSMIMRPRQRGHFFGGALLSMGWISWIEGIPAARRLGLTHPASGVS